MVNNMMKDIRWHQRLQNFNTALEGLRQAIELASTRPLSDLEEQGLIQAFEYNFELSWNVIKDFYTEQGETDIQGSRDAYRMAFKRGLIEAGEVWMGMIKSRMLTSHTYNKKTAQEIVEKIKSQYFLEFVRLSAALESKK